MRIFMIMLPLLAATGCEQAYRYPCQDPANWQTPECQRPLCEVHRDCPELIFKENPNIMIPKPQIQNTPAPVSQPQGECK